MERTRLAEFAKDKKIPVISGCSEFAESGGLMTYGFLKEILSRLAVYAKNTRFAGEKPNEIPIEQPSTFEWQST